MGMGGRARRTTGCGLPAGPGRLRYLPTRPVCDVRGGARSTGGDLVPRGSAPTSKQQCMRYPVLAELTKALLLPGRRPRRVLSLHQGTVLASVLRSPYVLSGTGTTCAYYATCALRHVR
eukprot:1421859-Rhodomonas_salina.1